MYQLDMCIGAGRFGVFFRIKDHPRVGAKIYLVDEFYNNEFIKKELEKARVIKELGISVPRYVGIADFLVPSDIQEKLGFVRMDSIKKSIVLSWAGKTKKGLIIEILENDLQSVPIKELRDQYAIEKAKLDQLGIRARETGPTTNVLWSNKKKRIYLIDFDDWVFPKEMSHSIK
ncbi:MAG: hypothetical protein ABIJ21_05995 [Nanoarchaeota archaeon]